MTQGKGGRSRGIHQKQRKQRKRQQKLKTTQSQRPRVFQKKPTRAGLRRVVKLVGDPGGDKRSCGNCTACCLVLGIHEIQKPCFETCPNVRPRKGARKAGCLIYGGRPQECQDYICHWREGLLMRRHRPDRSGLIIDSAEGFLDEVYKVTALEHIVIAREIRANTALSDLGQEVLRALAYRVYVIVGFHPDSTRFALPIWGPTPEGIESISQATDELVPDDSPT